MMPRVTPFGRAPFVHRYANTWPISRRKTHLKKAGLAESVSFCVIIFLKVCAFVLFTNTSPRITTTNLIRRRYSVNT